jgi:hypothetical protein
MINLLGLVVIYSHNLTAFLSYAVGSAIGTYLTVRRSRMRTQ